MVHRANYDGKLAQLPQLLPAGSRLWSGADFSGARLYSGEEEYRTARLRGRIVDVDWSTVSLGEEAAAPQETVITQVKTFKVGSFVRNRIPCAHEVHPGQTVVISVGALGEVREQHGAEHRIYWHEVAVEYTAAYGDALVAIPEVLPKGARSRQARVDLGGCRLENDRYRSDIVWCLIPNVDWSTVSLEEKPETAPETSPASPPAEQSKPSDPYLEHAQKLAALSGAELDAYVEWKRHQDFTHIVRYKPGLVSARAPWDWEPPEDFEICK